MSLLEKIFWAAIGALVMRYIILNTPDYKAKEAAKLDAIRNDVHDYLKKLDPEADDEEIAKDVMSIIPE
jgi:hypothetical protein